MNAGRLFFSIGPVGSFIGEARRSRDYWAGSFLLSWLTGQAIVAGLGQGGKLVIPVAEADPMLATMRTPTPQQSGPFLGSLPNKFELEFQKAKKIPAAAMAAETQLQNKWVQLSDLVRKYVLDDFSFLEDEDRIKACHRIWDAQIGKSDAPSPFWEVLWCSAEAPKSGQNTIDAVATLKERKAARVSSGSFLLTGMEGNFCSLIPGQVDISGLHRGSTQASGQAYRAFWQSVRRHLNRKRYGPHFNWDGDACLDLRETESLCAPALVKRLFPLVANLSQYDPVSAEAREELGKVIGWMPASLATPVAEVSTETKSFFARLLSQFRRGGAEQPTSTQNIDIGELPDILRRDLLLWPSVSYIAATHWVARVHRSAPELAETFALEIAGTLGPRFALAESSLWLKAVHDVEDNQAVPLASIDGSLFFPSRLEGTLKQYGVQEPPSQRLTNALADISAAPLSMPAGVTRSYAKETAGVGAPANYYAIICADVDGAGDALRSARSAEQRDSISKKLNEFSQKLSGYVAQSGRPEDGTKLVSGALPDRNGIILYAGADEVVALAPIEDAFEIGLAIEKCFGEVRSSAHKDLEKLSISVSVLYCRVRVPLRWALREAKGLLDRVAKESCGRASIALGTFELDGLGSVWAVPFRESGASGAETRGLAAFKALYKSGIEQDGRLLSNEFFHSLLDTLAPFLVVEGLGRHDEVRRLLHKHEESGHLGKPHLHLPDTDEMRIAEQFIAGLLRSYQSVTRSETAETLYRIGSAELLDVMTFQCRERAENQTLRYERRLIYPAALDILRLVAANWRKDTGDILPDLTSQGEGGALK